MPEEKFEVCVYCKGDVQLNTESGWRKCICNRTDVSDVVRDIIKKIYDVAFKDGQESGIEILVNAAEDEMKKFVILAKEFKRIKKLKRRNFLKMFGIGVGAIAVPLNVLEGDKVKGYDTEHFCLPELSKEQIDEILKHPVGGYKIVEFKPDYAIIHPNYLICDDEHRKDFEKLARS